LAEGIILSTGKNIIKWIDDIHHIIYKYNNDENGKLAG
jgi:hypothetical protein